MYNGLDFALFWEQHFSATDQNKGGTMFVTIRKYNGCTDVQALNEIIKLELIPLLQKTKGFQSYAAVDCGHHAVLSIGMFDTKEAAESANAVAQQTVQKLMAKLLPHPPEITIGHVLT